MSVEKKDLDKLKTEIIKVIRDQSTLLVGHFKKINRRFSVVEDRLTEIEFRLDKLEVKEGDLKTKIDEWELKKTKEKTHSEIDDKDDDWLSGMYH